MTLLGWIFILIIGVVIVNTWTIYILFQKIEKMKWRESMTRHAKGRTK